MKILNTLLLNRSLRIVSLFVFTAGLSVNCFAAQSKVPEPFQGEDNESKYTISYDDYSALLRIIVLDTGRSFRETAPRSKARTGTRLKSKRNVYTTLEGNRINFSEIKKDDNLKVIQNIRKSLESVPDEVSLNLFNNNEQLAYWLNLYNVTMIEQVAQLYPQKKIEDELFDEDDGVIYQKLLTVSGVKLSLNDIHQNIIIEKFGFNPLVMYGLFQGVIGGPNIRRSAYTGNEVFKQLQDNAEEFINSNRGTFTDDKGVMRISSFYESNRRLFGNFEVDLRQHLTRYANSDYVYSLESAESFKANIKDMSICDVMGSEREYGGAIANNSAAVLSLESVSSGASGGNTGIFGVSAVNFTELSEEMSSKAPNVGRYSPDLLKMLDNLKRRNEAKSGTVVIKEEGKVNENENNDQDN